jgi:hypothetical protein
VTKTLATLAAGMLWGSSLLVMGVEVTDPLFWGLAVAGAAAWVGLNLVVDGIFG